MNQSLDSNLFTQREVKIDLLEESTEQTPDTVFSKTLVKNLRNDLEQKYIELVNKDKILQEMNS